MKTIEEMWKEYLKSMSSELTNFSSFEKRMMRRAFFAGFNRAYAILYPDLPVDIYTTLARQYESEMDAHSEEG